MEKELTVEGIFNKNPMPMTFRELPFSNNTLHPLDHLAIEASSFSPH